MFRIWLTVLGTGYLPLAPGTWASGVVLGVFVLASGVGCPVWGVGVIMLVLAGHGFWVTAAYGGRFIEKYGEDPSLIVSDEQCGQAVTYLCFFWLGHTVGGIKEILYFGLIGFVLFRIFDIIKPPPVKQFDNMKGAWGVLLDDVMAGVYANVLLQVIWWVYNSQFTVHS